MEKRIEQSAGIILNGYVDDVFPLFDAVEEKKWAPGWELNVVYPENEIFEENMVFTTDSFEEDETELLWIVSLFDNTQHKIKYTVFGKERVWTITINCKESGDKTSASITYSFTGLTEKGCEKNECQLERIFKHDLSDWQSMINSHLLNVNTDVK